MRTTAVICCMLLFAVFLQAQISIPSSADVKKTQLAATTEVSKASSQANIGSLIGQLTNGISVNSFTDSFKKNKSDFVSKTSKVSDAAGASSALQTLAGGLLPAAMDAGWGAVKSKWFKDAKTANTVKSVAGIAGALESHISPNSFKGDWATARPAWQAALGALAK